MLLRFTFVTGSLNFATKFALRAAVFTGVFDTTVGFVVSGCTLVTVNARHAVEPREDLSESIAVTRHCHDPSVIVLVGAQASPVVVCDS
ncbi:MAG TPA: hypothetical protein VFD59_01340, partial [Nocardioidaceae bacterium]|nr:hypothetical protein [Nocardioidaceae bacterium]